MRGLEESEESPIPTWAVSFYSVGIYLENISTATQFTSIAIGSWTDARPKLWKLQLIPSLRDFSTRSNLKLSSLGNENFIVQELFIKYLRV